MAYADRYTLISSDVFERKYKVQIQQKDYEGVSESLIGAEGSPVTIGFEGSSGTNVNKYDPIKAMYCNLTIYSLIDYQFIELFTSDADKYKVIVSIFENNVYIPWFIGYIEPDIYEEPYVMPPYEVTVRSVDGLVRLKNVNFESTGLNASDSLLKIMLWCLNQTGLGLSIETFASIYETRMTDIDQDSVFYYTYAKLLAFIKDDKPLSAYEVLEQILIVFGCTLMQYKGRWVVGRVDDRFEDVPLTFKYLSTGSADGYGSMQLLKSFTPARVGYEDMVRPVYSNSMLMVVPAWKSFVINQDYLYNSNGILRNYNMLDYNLVSGKKAPKYWNAVNGEWYLEYLSKFEREYCRIDSYTKYNNLSYIYAGTIIGIVINAMFGSGSGNHAIRIALNNPNNTDYYYLAENGDKNRYTWHLSTLEDINRRVPSIAEQEFSEKWRIKHDPANDVYVEPAPISGNIIVYIGTWTGVISGSYIDYCHVTIDSIATDQIKHSREIETLINDNNNYIPPEQNIIIGDVPAINYANIMYDGCLMLSNGDVTSEWLDTFSGLQSQLLLCLAFNIGRQYVKPSIMVQGTFKGTMDFMTTFIDTSNFMRKFVWSHQVEYNVKQAEFHGYMVELLPIEGTRVLGDESGNAIEAATDQLIAVTWQ